MGSTRGKLCEISASVGTMASGQLSGRFMWVDGCPLRLGPLVTLGDNFRALSHFVNCREVPPRLAFAVHSPVPHSTEESVKAEKHHR